MALPNCRWAGANPLTQAAPTQRILAIAEDPATLERIAAAIQAGGATPVLVRSLEDARVGARTSCPSASPSTPGTAREAGLKLVTSKMREGAQLVGVTPPSNLAALTRLLNDPRCNHVLTADDAGFATVAVTIQKFVTGDLFGIEKYLPQGHRRAPDAPARLQGPHRRHRRGARLRREGRRAPPGALRDRPGRARSC